MYNCRMMTARTNLFWVLTRGYSKLPPPMRNPQMPNTKLMINNEWVDAKEGATFKTVNPTTEKVITTVQAASQVDVDLAVEAATAAFDRRSPWRRWDASRRAAVLFKLADLVERDSAYLASLESLEVGKLYTGTLKGDLVWSYRGLRYFAGLADKACGSEAKVDGPFMTQSRIQPQGVAALITAWNFSSLMVIWKIGNALAAGCTAVVKPSQHSTLAALHIAALCIEAGIPPGVVNFLPGTSSVGAALVTHPKVINISFTGSTPVGKWIYKEAAANMKRLTLMLGGKSANIILKDADIDKAVEHAHYAAFHNMGQCCCAGSRTFVHESIYDKFLEKAVARIRSRKIGDPFDHNVQHGPQANEEQLGSVLGMIQSGKEEGAHLEIGGNRHGSEGFFIEPTLFTNVSDDMVIAREEIFGPVQQIFKFKTIDEVLDRANSSNFGLAASVFSNNLDEVNTLVQGLDAGSVWVNCYFQILPQTPFGGFKDSGIGREGGLEGFKAFTEVKSVYMKTDTKIS